LTADAAPSYIGLDCPRRIHRIVPERRTVMPLYQFYCSKCQKEVALTLTVKAREAGAKCPECQGRLEPLLATFYSKTSRKS